MTVKKIKEFEWNLELKLFVNEYRVVKSPNKICEIISGVGLSIRLVTGIAQILPQKVLSLSCGHSLRFGPTT